jgi:hypothetical protein
VLARIRTIKRVIVMIPTFITFSTQEVYASMIVYIDAVGDTAIIIVPKKKTE